MLNFLRKTRSFVNCKEPICIILGNESCDLDSAVSAIAASYCYQNLSINSCMKSQSLKTSKFLPILNIPRYEFVLKTEVNYLFKLFNIDVDCLTFYDELNSEFLSKSQFVLVDHHVSSWRMNTVAVYDHRTVDKSTEFHSNCEIHIEQVGSCATIIGELLLKTKVPAYNDWEILEMLRNVIILDTVNFSANAARVTLKDLEICSLLEKRLELFFQLQPRQKIFDGLVNARGTINNLTAFQLLRKDLKIIRSKEKQLTIALPGFPITVEQFLCKPNVKEAIEHFAKDTRSDIVLLIGMYIDCKNNKIFRDIGLININNLKLFEILKRRLVTLENPNLLLKSYNCNFLSGVFYHQKNIKATRKQILLVAKETFDSYSLN